MKNILIIGGICVLVIAVGVWLFTRNEPRSISVPQDASAASARPIATNVPFKVLDQGIRATGETSRKNYAIYDAKKFSVLWKEAHGSDGLPVPSVDFTKNYVIAVFAGTVPTGGYSIAVDAIRDTQSARSVAIGILEPGKGCSVVEEQTSPYQFVLVPFSDAMTLSHTDVRMKKDCK